MMGIFKGLFITRDGDDLTRKEIEAFWKQGVCMDDYDYLVLLEDPDSILEQVIKEDRWDDTVIKEKAWEPKDYEVGRLLQGCCSNKWYKAKFRGKKYAVGVAYHA